MKTLQTAGRWRIVRASGLSITTAAVLVSCWHSAQRGGEGAALVQLAGDGAPLLLCVGDEFHAGVTSPDGRFVAVAHEGGDISVWDVRGGRLLFRFSSGVERVVGAVGYGHELAFSTDGSLLAAGGLDGRVRVWRTATGELLAALLQAPRNNLVTKPSGSRARVVNAIVAAVAFTPGGESLVSGSSDGRVITWSTRDWYARDSLWATEGWLRDLALADGGRTLVVASYDGSVRFWSRDRSLFLGEIRSPPALTSLEFNPDATVLALSGDYSVIRFWSRRTGLLSDSVTLAHRPSPRFALSPDGNLLAVGLERGVVGLWDLRTNRWRHVQLPSQRAIRLTQFTADGAILVTGQFYDRYLVLSPIHTATADRPQPLQQPLLQGQSPCD